MVDESDLALQYALRAESDYETALVIFEGKRPRTANNVCYHCHQAAENISKQSSLNIKNVIRAPMTSIYS